MWAISIKVVSFSMMLNALDIYAHTVHEHKNSSLHFQIIAVFYVLGQKIEYLSVPVNVCPPLTVLVA